MSAFKGTPGPWEAVKANWDHMYIRHALRGDAHVPGYIADVNNIGKAYEANARLIAAAPELLEACHGVDVLYSELGKAMPGIVNTPAYDAVQEAVRKARAAIAKALGEQP